MADKAGGRLQVVGRVVPADPCRAEGAGEEEARQRIVQAIQGSDEWKAKHPPANPK